MDANRIRIRRDRDNGIDEYKLLKFKRSNQELTSIKPIVNRGERVEGGSLADGPATDMSEIA